MTSYYLVFETFNWNDDKRLIDWINKMMTKYKVNVKKPFEIIML